MYCFAVATTAGSENGVFAAAAVVAISFAEGPLYDEYCFAVCARAAWVAAAWAYAAAACSAAAFCAASASRVDWAVAP